MILLKEYIRSLQANDLLISVQGLEADFEITGKPVTDSRQIQAGDVFVCIRGYLSDGHAFIGKAREMGAALVVQEDDFADDKPAIRVKCTRKAAALLARMYFDNPTGKFTLIGVTGTNGKTTTSLLLRQALTQLGYLTGWIGTLGYSINDEIIPTNNTTPDILELNTIFRQMVEAGCRYVVMEVSSHALSLDRVFGLEYDLAMFTNLSRDHLDFHKDMTDYAESKFRLFEYTTQNNGICLINTDDEYGKEFYDRLKAIPGSRLVSISENEGDFLISGFDCSLTGSSIQLLEPQAGSTGTEQRSKVDLTTNLIGHFNVLNSAMTYAAVRILLPAVARIKARDAFAVLEPVRGRLEKVSNGKEIGVFVDYAHTPDALKSVLSAISRLPHNRLLVLFGAGGNRDKGKRPEMLHEVLLKADATIITDDNPRGENPAQIIRDILDGTELWSSWWIIRDRKKAIQSILRLAQPGDIVLIAGKGHETYQEYNGVRHHFDDVEVAGEFLNIMASKDNIATDNTELILPIDPLMLELLYNSSFTFSNRTVYEGVFRSEEAFDDGILIKGPVTRSGPYFTRISTDSRNTPPGSLFFAIKGENFDGMDYVPSVLKDSTCAAVISRPGLDDSHTILHSDTQKAMGLLAGKYIRMFGAYRIALTGSTGKTTTKEILANIFSQSGKTLKTEANENNIIGLCKTIFRIKPEHKTAIIELGTNHFGEIAQLADICDPQTALITNIGPSHLEYLVDEDGVYFEKTALFRRKLDYLVFPGDDNRFDEYRQHGVCVGYSEKCTYTISDVVRQSGIYSFNLAGKKWKTNAAALVFVNNVAFAITVAVCLGQKNEDIQAGILLPTAAGLRMDIRGYGNRQVIWDCYNANPDSMKAALEFWAGYESQKPHIAILGDMLELGTNTVLYHKGIGRLLASAVCEMLITVGILATNYQERNSTCIQPESANLSFERVEDLIQSGIIHQLPDNSIILVKASHGIHLEKLIPVMETLLSQSDKSSGTTGVLSGQRKE